MKGAFQISREMFDHSIWNDVPKFRIFFFILGNAVFSEEGVKKGNIHIKRGQYLRSFRNLQSDLEYIENRAVKKYSLSVVKRKISSLVDEKMLEIEETELGTLFTVVNYSEYQGFERYKKVTENSVGTALEHSENTLRTGMEQGWNNNKNVKKEKNEKKPNAPYLEVIEHLNKKAGRNFKSTASAHRKYIKARWEEGATVEEFKRVIDVCCHNWKGKEFSNGKKGDDYLKPSTLFNEKFDERLNWAMDSHKDVAAQEPQYKSNSADPEALKRLGIEY